MNKINKIVILATILSTIIFSCIGCTHKDEENDKPDGKTAVSNEAVAFEEFAQLTGISGSYHWYCVKEDHVYVTAIQYDKEKKAETGIRLYMLDLDGSNMQELPLPADFNCKIGMSEFDFDTKQNIYYLTTYEENGEEFIELVKIGADGNEAARIRLADTLDISNDEIGSDFSVSADGMVVVYSRDKLYLLGEDLSLVETIKIKEGELVETTTSKEGGILCILKTASDDEGGYTAASLDVDKKRLNKLHKMNISEYYDIISGNGDYDLYYTDDYGVYGYNMENEIGEKVFDYMASGVTFTDIKPLGNGNFIGEKQVDDDTSVMVIYGKKESAEGSQRKILTYATVNMDSDIKSAIYEFNNSQSDIEIVIKDYSSEVNPIEKMSTDIIAGNIPDIFDLKELSVEQYVQKGLLEDLTPFYAEDASIHESDLIPSVLQAMKIDDKIYYVSTGFHVISLAAKVSDVGNASGWDYENLNELLSQKDEDAQFFYINNKQDLLHMILWCQSTDFVDKQNGNCHFDSEDFKNLLKICNERGVNDEDYEWTESEVVLLRKGDVLFRDVSTDMDCFKETLAIFGEDVNFIGLPSSDKQGNYINFCSQIGISSKSEYKEEAWGFLRTLMSKEYQGGTMSFENLPTRQDCFQLRLEAEMATEDYTNEMGREIFVHNGISDIDGVSYEIKPLTKEQAKQYVDIINRATKVADYDEKIMEIVQEEAKYYFLGDRNLEDTADIIQKRVSTYINEGR